MNPLRILKHRLSTTSLPPALTLHSHSPLIRPLHPSSSTATPALTLAKPDDFVLYPNFLNEEEQEVLVATGLWKLGRSRGGDRRRARRQKGASAGAVSDTGAKGLQRLFTGEYAFEEVRQLLLVHACMELC